MPLKKFNFNVIKKDGFARLGEIQTIRGKIDTPTFMPVGTQATIKGAFIDDIIKTGTRTKKTSAGYNLTNLFIGSEGTLGIITEVHLRLSPIPENIMSAVCHFPDLDSAVLTSQEIIQFGIPIARIELLNKDQMEISID